MVDESVLLFEAAFLMTTGHHLLDLQFLALPCQLLIELFDVDHLVRAAEEHVDVLLIRIDVIFVAIDIFLKLEDLVFIAVAHLPLLHEGFQPQPSRLPRVEVYIFTSYVLLRGLPNQCPKFPNRCLELVFFTIRLGNQLTRKLLFRLLIDFLGSFTSQ